MQRRWRYGKQKPGPRQFLSLPLSNLLFSWQLSREWHGHGVPPFEQRVGAAWDLATAFRWDIRNGSAWAPCIWER